MFYQRAFSSIAKGKITLGAKKPFLESRLCQRNLASTITKKNRSNTFLGLIGGAIIGSTTLWYWRNHNQEDDEHHAHAETKLTSEGVVEVRMPTEMLEELQRLFGSRCVSDIGTREAYGKDFSFNTGMAPDVVVQPKTEEEVRKIVQLCAKHKVAIVPYGSGTSLEGHINAVKGGVCISFGLMKEILEIHPEDMFVVVQPGITYDELNAQLAPAGFFFPMDPGPGASIGGMVGTSCSGTNAVRYGTMKENVLSLNVVIPNGDLVKTRQRAKKSSAGYDLTHLFIGAEGTLGVTTKIVLKIQRIPPAKAVAISQFPTVHDAANTAIQIIQKGIPIGKVELLDDLMMKAVNVANQTQYPEANTLFFEFSGTMSQIEEQKAIVESLASSNRGSPLRFATEKQERDDLWLARKTALLSAPSLRSNTEVKITDVCVPISRIADCIQQTKDDLASSPLLAPMVGHLGDGNFHAFILLDPSKKEDIEEVHRLDHRLIERAINMGGTCTGEHGVGVGKREYLPLELGPEAVNLMRTIKKAIDPENIMNPGKIIPPEELMKKA